MKRSGKSGVHPDPHQFQGRGCVSFYTNTKHKNSVQSKPDMLYTPMHPDHLPTPLKKGRFPVPCQPSNVWSNPNVNYLDPENLKNDLNLTNYIFPFSIH